jgi:bifunctional DNA-binding transcriptional regulator/antitoxin component of YhaV-PrlF toxin-antitoxin module
MMVYPTQYCGKKMEQTTIDQVTVKVDSKGRICIPAEIREEIGETITLKRTPEGFLMLPGTHQSAVEELRKIINSKHKRTGKPENWSSEKMKSIWGKTE